jgi:hypothetical protein
MRLRTLFLIAVTLAAASPSTYATSLTATFTGPGAGLWNFTSPAAPSESNIFSGQLVWQYTGSPEGYAPSNLDGSNQFRTYCIELTKPVESANFTVQSLADVLPAKATDISKLVYAAEVTEHVNIFGPGSGADFNTKTAGFQLALWEVVNETPPIYNINGGNFVMNGDAGALAFANSLLLDIQTGQTNGSLVALVAGVTQQGQIVIGPSPALFVPLPGAAAALLPGMLLGGWSLKSKRRRQHDEQLAND